MEVLKKVLTSFYNYHIAILMQYYNSCHEKLICIRLNFKLFCWIWEIEDSANTMKHVQLYNYALEFN